MTSIEDCIIDTISPARMPGRADVPKHMLTNLKSFDYTAIFPFSNHANFNLLLHQVDELNLQLAPEPHNRILNDKAPSNAQMTYGPATVCVCGMKMTIV